MGFLQCLRIFKGMGADLFGSFAEATCAALVIASQSEDLWYIITFLVIFVDFCRDNYAAVMYPLSITAAGIIVCFITSFFATHILVVHTIPDIEKSLKRQLLIVCFRLKIYKTKESYI